MKYPGLQKILNMISSDPSSLIINRNVSLVRDINDEEDKIIAIQELAKIMIDIDPQETLKYALCVFENNQSLDSLKIIYNAVMALGKVDKASVIKQEIDRLEKIQLEEHKINVKATQNSNRSFKPEATSPSINDIFKEEVATETNYNSAINSDSTVLIDESNKDSLYASRAKEFNAEMSKTHYKQDDKIKTALPKTSILPPIPKVDDMKKTNNESSTVLLEDLSSSNTNKTSIIEPPPTPSSSHISTNISRINQKVDPVDNTSDVLIELFDFYWKNNLWNEAKNLLDSTASSYSKSSWWLARSSAISKKIEDINNLKESSSTILNTNSSEINTSLNEDEIFWNNVDNIMKEGNYRKALANIRSELSTSIDKDSSWNWNLYQRINTILNALGYHSISWDSSLDKNILYNQVMHYIPQKISTTVVL